MKPVWYRVISALLLVVITLTAPVAEAADFEASVQTILNVGPEGKGNPEATAAWKELVKSPIQDLPRLLAAFDNANPLAANWLRSAAESIAARELKATGKLPQAELEKFIAETQHNPRARRMAYEWVLQVDPTAADRLIPGMLNDPSIEFRRDAVARLIDTGTKQLTDNQNDQAKATFEQALNGARDEDQIEAVVKPLDKLGVKVDLARHFGFIMDWYLIGPFDNTGKKGFALAYPPESEIKLEAKYAGQKGEVAWAKHVTDEKYGLIDLSKVTAPHKGAVTYAFTEFVSDKDQTVDVRLGSPNAYKVWVNGELVFGREEYHRGMSIDQYRMTAKLKQGKNQILLKVCQNEQTEDWAQRWQYQLRICDATGTAILSTARPAPVPPATVSMTEEK
ncbi:MAG: hypothetical protein V4719_05275 [Planctomycetota bacterium]